MEIRGRDFEEQSAFEAREFERRKRVRLHVGLGIVLFVVVLLALYSAGHGPSEPPVTPSQPSVIPSRDQPRGRVGLCVAEAQRRGYDETTAAQMCRR